MKSQLTNSVKNRTHLIKEVLHKGLWNPNATILMYHRVTQPEVDPWMLCVSPDNFYQQMEVLKDYAVIPIQELVENIKKNKLTRSLSISFDDGYQDNYFFAKPVLESFNAPATFFIATGFIGQMREFWSDELEKILLEPGELPSSLHLSIDNFHFSWDLGKDCILSENQRRHYKNWIAWEPPPGNRHALYYELSRQLRQLPLYQREALFEQLADWADQGRTFRQENLPMTNNNLLELSKYRQFEIGAHTVSHPALSLFPQIDQREEINGSISWLEQLLKKKISGFAFPHGAYNADTLNLLKENDLRYACTTEQKPIDNKDNLLTLPRYRVRNWNGKDFKQKIDRWLRFGI